MNRKISSQYILDLYKSNKNYGKLSKFNIKKVFHNPLCGDTITIYLLIEDNIIKDVSFESNGCMISKVAAIISLDMVKNQNVEILEKIKFEELLEKMMMESITSSRKKCAELAFNGLKSIKKEKIKQ